MMTSYSCAKSKSIEMAAFAACEIAVQSDNFIHIRHPEFGCWVCF